MTESPLVSVIIPVYNGEKYLLQAIESVLHQTYKPIEIIVVDDGSTDNSAKIAQNFDLIVKCSKIKHSGLSQALNHGISLCQGEYIGFLDSDDLWVENKLTLQMNAFRNNPELEAVFGHINQFKSLELDEISKNKLKILVDTLPGYHKDTLLITKSSLARVGLFDPQVRIDFLDWYLKATEKRLKTLMLKDVLAKRRLHQSNMGIKARYSRVEYARILKASLDRRRKMGLI